MKMICAPSQVMRDGSDLNQHGQAGRQEQASSSSPFTFHEVLLAAAAPRAGRPKAAMPHTIATETIDLLNMIPFISFSSHWNVADFLSNCNPDKRVVNTLKSSFP